MATAALRRAMTAFTRPPDPTDADLLRRFADARSEDAFAALVRRHGPLVLGVCRRVVPDRHLADDAFQAAFVVLARRAGGIDPARPLGPWLYGVAHRVALRARTMLGKRRKRETLTAAVPDTPRPSPAVDDAAAVLDDEIGKLPPAARDAVILCELQGLSRREAANKLGIAEGTLSSRLAAARKTLAEKLHSRGVVLSAALAGAAVVSPQLASAAVAAGTGAALSSVVVSLADGASAMTLFNKLKLTGVAVLFLLLSAGGVGPWGANESAAAPVPKQKPDGELLWVLNDITFELHAYSPDGKKVKEFKLPEGNRYLGLTPDGQQIAFAGKGGKVADPKVTAGLTVHLRDIGDGVEGTDTGLDYQPGDYFVWSPDADRVVRSRKADPANQFSARVCTLYDLATKKGTELKLPADHHPWQWALDGTWLLVFAGEEFKAPNWSKFTLADGKMTSIATNFPCFRADVSPDGKSLIGYAHRVVKENGEPRHDRKLIRVDTSTGGETPLGEFAEPAGFGYGWARWSPDGKRLAFWYSARNKADAPVDDMHLSICDAATGERKTIATLPFNPWVLQGWFPDARKIKAPVPKEKAEGGLIWVHDRLARELVAYSPDGTVRHKVEVSDNVSDRSRAVGITRDGRQAIIAVGVGDKRDTPPYTLHLLPLFERGKAVNTKIDFGGTDRVDLNPDGKTLTVVRIDRPDQNPEPAVHRRQYDLTTFKEVAIPEPKGIPKGYHFHHEFANGDRLISRGDPLGSDRRSYYLLPADGGKKRLITGDHEVGTCDVSPDGGKLLIKSRPAAKQTAGDPNYVVHVIDVATGDETQIAAHPFLSSVEPVWSPDGKRVAYRWYEHGMWPGNRFGKAVALPTTRGEVAVCDADGGNSTVLRKLEGNFDDDFMRRFDWANDQPVLVGWAPAPQKIKAPVPKEKADGELIWTHNAKTGALTAYTPDGETAKTLTLKDGTHFHGLTPDGTKVAFAGTKGKLADQGVSDGLTLHLRPVSDAAEGTDTGLSLAAGDNLHWSPDGTRVVRVRHGPMDKNGGLTYEHVVFDPATKKETKAELPVNHYVIGWAADGKTWLVHEYVRADLRNPNLPRYRVLAVPAGGGDKLTPLCDAASLTTLAPADDGKSYHAVGHAHANPVNENEDATYRRWFRVNDTGQAAVVKTFTEFDSFDLRSSPDRKRVVGLLRTTGDDASETVLAVYDPDGTNERKLATLPKDGQHTRPLGWFPAPKIKAPVPKAKDKSLIWLHDSKTGEFIAYAPDGTEAERWKLPRDQSFLGVTPDGARILYEAGGTYHLRPFGENTAGTDLGVRYNRFDRIDAWHPDGTKFLKSRHEQPGRMVGVRFPQVDYEIVDVAAKTTFPFRGPENTYTLGWTPDGKQFVGNTVAMGENSPRGLCLFPLPQKNTPGRPERTPLTLDDTATPLTFAPSADGKTQLVGGWKIGANDRLYHAAYRLDPATATLTELMHEDGQHATTAVPSPDGTRMAALWEYTTRDDYAPEQVRLSVADADGRDRRTVTLRDKVTKADRDRLHLLGWFPQKVKAPVPKAKANDEVLLVTSMNGRTPFLLVSPDGKTQEALPVPAGVEPRTVRVSPDGRWTAYGEMLAKGGAVVQGYHPCRVRVIDLHAPDAEPRTLLDETYGESLSWAADGKAVYVSRFDPEQIAAIRGQKNGIIPTATTLITLADGKEMPVPLPDGHRALAVSPDGNTWLTHTIDVTRTTNEAFVVTMKDGKVEKKAEVGKSQLATQLSADGKRALCGTGSVDPGQPQLASAELATMKLTEIKLPDGVNKNWIGFARWSADGTRLAFAWSEQVRVRQRNGGTAEAFRVTVCDADGKNPVTAVELEPGAHIRGIDWLPARPADPKAKPPVREPIKAPVPKGPPPEGVIVASKLCFKPPGDVLEVMGTDGKHLSYLPVGELMNVQRARVSPDGKRLAFVRFIPLNAQQRGSYHYPQDVYVVDLPLTEAPTEPTFKKVLDPQIAWAPDGTSLFLTTIPDGTDMAQGEVAGKVLPRKTVRYDAATKKETAVELPKGHEVQDVSPDGKTLLTRIKVWGGGFGKTGYSSFLVPLDTLKPRAIGDEDDGFEIARFSPDSTRLVGTRPGLSKSKEQGVFIADVATGKVEKVPLAKEVVAGLDNGCVAWAPDGKRLAVMWEQAGRQGPAKPNPDRTKRILVVGTDGKDEKVIREFGENESVLHIDWADPKLTEPKAKPPAKEPITAPVPKEKENTMGLTARVTPEKKEVMLGEPTYFTFTVANPTDKGWGFDVGGDYRNRLGRPESFAVEVTGPDGKAVPQPDAGPTLGGIGGVVPLPADGKHTFTLFLPHWATFDKPGEYTISVRRKLSLVPLDLPADERDKAKPEVATVAAAAKITVTKPDAKAFGDLIDTLGAELTGPRSERAERATKMLLEIRDERVIPHFVELGKLPHPSPRMSACEGLKKFKTDEAFAALKALAATTGDDLKGSAVNRELEESSARGVRQAAVHALADCPHPDALPLVWKAVGDESDAVRMTVLQKAFGVKSAEARKIIEKLTGDADERVRNEAKRYADLLAKEE